jgi:hypothetical protein
MIFNANEASYQNWRATKLDRYPEQADDLIVNIGGLNSLQEHEKTSIRGLISRANMAIYDCQDKSAERAAIRQFAAGFGLLRLDHHLCANADGVAELSVASEGQRGDYVPYSNRSLSWHTDGYYNEAGKNVRAVVLHCDQDAAAGGENAVLDPEIAYVRLRDENPAFIDAFSHPECMAIPANTVDGVEIRPAVCGPVFSFNGADGANGALHMRYSERKKHIHWRTDDITTAAREWMSELLASNDRTIYRFTLKPGQGLISNNVLHNRSAFEDLPNQNRFLYRARYFDRVESSLPVVGREENHEKN